MGKFSLYNIPLKNLEEGLHAYQYTLDDQYFKLITDADSDVKKGVVKVDLTIKRVSNSFDFNFELKGDVIVPCDRCLDDMTVEIETKNRLVVKFGDEYAEESDDIVIIPEVEGEINIAWFLYEFVTLSIPMKHIHAPGKCNKVMTNKYNKHKAISTEDEDLTDDEDLLDNSDDNSADLNDPRWDGLKNINIEEE